MYDRIAAPERLHRPLLADLATVRGQSQVLAHCDHTRLRCRCSAGRERQTLRWQGRAAFAQKLPPLTIADVLQTFLVWTANYCNLVERQLNKGQITSGSRAIERDLMQLRTWVLSFSFYLTLASCFDGRAPGLLWIEWV